MKKLLTVLFALALAGVAEAAKYSTGGGLPHPWDW